RSAGIPVFAGLASRNHPSAALATQPDWVAPMADKRRYLLQAALLLSIP
ncbi:ornithine carbamoyltransferase, partial [Pelomonas sp. HMWF004]